MEIINSYHINTFSYFEKLSSYNLRPKFVHAKIVTWPLWKAKREVLRILNLNLSIYLSYKYSVVCFFIFLNFPSKTVLELIAYICFFKKFSSYNCFHLFPSLKQWSHIHIKSRKTNIMYYIQYTLLCSINKLWLHHSINKKNFSFL